MSSLKKLREAVLSKSLVNSEIINDIAYNARQRGILSGINRYITNFSQFEFLLDKFSIPIFDCNGLTLTEKCSSSSLYKYQITPIGANLMNYIFITQPITLFVIDHPCVNGHGFFIHIFQALGLPIDYNILEISNEKYKQCPSDHNIPYSIDCVKLDNFLCDFKAQLFK